MKNILPFILAALIGAGTFFGLRAYGSGRGAPTGEQPAAPVRESTLPLHVSEQEDVTAAPEPVFPPAVKAPDETAGTLEYREIVAQEEGLTIYRVQAKRYKGLLAEITDPLRLTVGTCGRYFSEGNNGRQVGVMADAAGAILAVNGGGFYDPNGTGTGGLPTGNVFVGGEQLHGEYSHTVGMDAEGRMYCGLYYALDCQNLGLQWALSYGPTLVIDGEVQQGLRTELEEPRTALGQREDGMVLLFCIQGRQPSALGVTEQELAHIMCDDLGCVNASNLDGGASSYMYYRGEYINIANTGGYPRNIPTCVMFLPAAPEVTP